MKQHKAFSVDTKIFSLLKSEQDRQRQCLSLIASENIVSADIRAVVGSELTNKYAEGYPQRRYYGGCEFHDEVESLAIERAKKLFSAEHANVQPHSGSNANMAAYFALAKSGSTILAMDLDHGGHLTHGSKVNFSGRLFKFIGYGVCPDTHLIDYEALRTLALTHRPAVIIAGASAYSRIIDFASFAKIAVEVDAKLVVDMAHIAGLVASGHHPSPVPYADVITSTTHKTLRGPRGGLILCKNIHQKAIDSWVFPGLQGGPLMHEIAGKAVCFYEALTSDFVQYQARVVANAQNLASILSQAGFKLISGGTDNHLILVDVTSLGLTGQEAEIALNEIGIVVNKNKIPFDQKSAMITSGIRLGTPSITSRGFLKPEIDLLGEIILDRLLNRFTTSILKEKVLGLAQRFTTV